MRTSAFTEKQNLKKKKSITFLKKSGLSVPDSSSKVSQITVYPKSVV